MKHLRIKTKLFQRAALTLLLAVAGIANASAGDWWGNAIYVNGKWYYVDDDLKWANDVGGYFDGINLGTISTISLNGQSLIFEDDNNGGGINWDGGGKVYMYYAFDNNFNSINCIELSYKEYTNKNNIFQRNGSTWDPLSIDISNFSPGNHSIHVWFKVDFKGEKYQNNSGQNYVATFAVAGSISVAAKQAPDNNYWTTFYCGNAKYAINSNENACAYTATVSGSTITLHKLGKVIPEKTAVIIVGQNNSISMNTSSASVENNVSNNLHGLDLAKPASTVITYYQGAKTIYMLSNKNNNFGFHDLGTNTTVPASKAFLALDDNDGARSRGFTIEFDDDGTTGIRTIDNGLTENDSWYSLDGRKFNGKPTAKGVYINNGKKIIIK